MKSIIAVTMLTLVATPAMAENFSNSASIPFVDEASVTSTINVSGLTGVISGLSVTLYGLEHSYPGDMLLGLFNEANGVGFVFMSGVGGAAGINNITITFSDFASYQLPQSDVEGSPFISGHYLPSNFYEFEFDSYPNAASFADFNGLSPNGNWTLLAGDLLSGDQGAITGGWSIDITTANAAVPEPATWAMMIGGFALVGASMRRKTMAVSFA